MKAICSKWVLTTGSALITAAFIWTAQAAETNPYLSIADRNPFGLKDPPPPPPPPEPPAAPAAPAASVKLTGITSIFSTHKALFEITEPGAGGKVSKPILCEGEVFDKLEVISINVAKGEVTIKMDGAVTNITFPPIEAAKAASPAKPTPPGRRTLPGRPAPSPRTAAALTSPNQGGPTIISRNGGAQTASRGSVTILGGSAEPAAVAPALPTPRTGSSYNAAATAANRLRAIPTRTIRTDPSRTATGSQSSSAPPMTKEQLRYWIEANRMVNPQLPYPPTSPSAPLPEEE